MTGGIAYPLMSDAAALKKRSPGQMPII